MATINYLILLEKYEFARDRVIFLRSALIVVTVLKRGVAHQLISVVSLGEAMIGVQLKEIETKQ